MSKIYFIINTSLIFLLFFSFSYSQEINSSQEIFVTGQIVPVVSSRAGVGVDVITQEDIQAIKPNTLDELLRYVSGISVKQSAAGKLTSVGIRGGSNGTTMILIDGNPINDAAGINNDIDISSMAVDNIERIEISKGPLSASLGSSAMNGAINIITKKGGDKPVEFSTSLQSSLLSQYFIGNASLYGSKDIVDYRINIGLLYDENVSSAGEKYGNTEKDSDAMGNYSAYIRLKPIDNLESIFYIDYTNRTSDIDNGPGAGNDNPDYILDTKRVNLSWKNIYLYNEIWEPSLKVAYTYNNRLYGSSQLLANNENDIFDGHTIHVEYENNIYILDELTLNFGLDYEYMQIDTKTSHITSHKNRNNVAPFIQANVNLFDSWLTVISFRGQKDEEYEFTPLYRISSVYDIKLLDLQLKASVGNGAMTPSLYQLYDPVFGNNQLKMQESLGYEVGFSNGLLDRKIVYGASWFYNKYDNMLTWGTYIDSDNSRKTGFYNELFAITYGVEANVEVDPIKYIKFGITYTWLQTFNAYGRPLERKPEHQVNAYVYITPIQQLKIMLGVIYNGESVATHYDAAEINDDYYLLNASISYAINDNIEVYLKGTNLTNTYYEEISGYGTKGVEVFAGLKAKI